MKKTLAAAIFLALIASGAFMTGQTRISEVEAQTQPLAVSQIMQKIIDEAEIRRVVDEIDNAVDAKDWTRCRQYFMDDINVDFSSLVGGQPARIKSDELVGGWRTNLYADKKSHHMRSNHRITINGDRAEVFSKGYAFNQLMMKTGGDLWEVWGDYRHTLERTAQGWKVSGMILNVTYARGNERARDFVPPK